MFYSSSSDIIIFTLWNICLSHTHYFCFKLTKFQERGVYVGINITTVKHLSGHTSVCCLHICTALELSLNLLYLPDFLSLLGDVLSLCCDVCEDKVPITTFVSCTWLGNKFKNAISGRCLLVLSKWRVIMCGVS